MKRILMAGAGLLALTLATAPTLAADMPVRAPVTKAPPAVAPVFNWTGFYAGASVGYHRHQTKWNDVDDWWIQGIFDIKASGAVFGAHAGHNWQTGNFVYGIETDISYSTADERFTVPVPEAVFIDTDGRWLGTSRVRLGCAMDKTLWYLTGGLAYSNSRAQWIEASGAQWERANWQFGYALGGGVEYAFSNPHWTVRLEGLLLQFRERAAKVIADDPGSPEDYRMRVKNRDVFVGLLSVGNIECRWRAYFKRPGIVRGFCFSRSFRDACAARGPGIQAALDTVSMDPGPGASRRPGMTNSEVA